MDAPTFRKSFRFSKQRDKRQEQCNLTGQRARLMDPGPLHRVALGPIFVSRNHVDRFEIFHKKMNFEREIKMK